MSGTEDVDPAGSAALRALEGLEDRPLAEHLAAFEAAHRELRAALDLDRG